MRMMVSAWLDTAALLDAANDRDDDDSYRLSDTIDAAVSGQRYDAEIEIILTEDDVAMIDRALAPRRARP